MGNNKNKQINKKKTNENASKKQSLKKTTSLKTTNKKRISKKNTVKNKIKPKNNAKKTQTRKIDYEPNKKKYTIKPKQKRKNKKNIKPIIVISLILIIIISISIYNSYINHKEAEYNKLIQYTFQTNSSNFEIRFEDIDHNLTRWQPIESNKTIETFARNRTIHLKNTSTDQEEKFKADSYFFKYYGEEDIFLTSNGSYTIDYIFYKANIDDNLSFVDDSEIVSIKDNELRCNKSGETIIYALFGNNKEKVLNVKSSLLIIDRPKEFDDTKPFLKCEQYSKEENEELDKILEEKINDVGYNTRAGAVEALRFLTLDLPFRVQYFNENGRYPHVDGEGRYYHKGLYLSSDKYNYLIDPDKENKGTWGCKIYSIPYGGKEENGLDCSGLICWALFNAGYDPNDSKGANLLLKLGDMHSSKKAISTYEVKVGDLVHNNEADSHIGMIIGVDEENNYYVAQSIWYKPNGVCISKYNKKQLISHWNEIVLMDKYYKDDGQLTNMWY